MSKDVRPIWTTTVAPYEYDIDGQMKRMVRLANKHHETFTPMDVGKVWGLYLAWKCLAKPARELRVVEAFCERVEQMAEAKMLATGKLEGAHYAAMRQVRDEMRIANTVPPAAPGREGAK